MHIEVLTTNTTQLSRVCQVFHEVVDFHYIFEAGAGQPQAAFQVLKRVRCLSAEIRRHAAVLGRPAPTRNENHFPGRGGDYVCVPGRVLAIEIQKLFGQLFRGFR